jgi:hypothetical protein
MWSPHRMCRRRSRTLSLNRNGEGLLLSEKKTKSRPNLVTQAIPLRHQQYPEGAPRRPEGAREFRGS